MKRSSSKARRSGLLLLVLLMSGAVMSTEQGLTTEGPVDARAVHGQASTTELPNGLIQIRLPSGRVFLTHGPDAAPDVAGLATDGFRQPVCATDYYQHILYGHLTLVPSDLENVREEIRQSVRAMNALLNRDSLQSGGPEADFKVLCDEAGEIKVDEFSSPSPDYVSVFSSAEAAGFTDPRAKYSIFFDAEGGVCGVGTFFEDDSPSQHNMNNQGPSYAATYRMCWDGTTPMHENGHNLGAVQPDAPYSTGSGAHCYEDIDVMCYSPDGGDKNQTGTVMNCPDREYYDCGYDTYFDASPEEGEYLHEHWNLGSRLNRFIAFAGDPPPPPPPPPPGNQPPIATFSRSCIGMECVFSPWGSDDGEINSFVWDFDDGTRSGKQVPRHTFQDPGTHTVTLTAIDDEFAYTSVAKVVVVDPVDPDPQATSLWLSEWEYANAAPSGGWVYYKIWVPPGAKDLRVSLYDYCDSLVGCMGEIGGLDCPVSCGTEIDLYVSAGGRPSSSAYGCRSAQTNDALSTRSENCMVSQPEAGWNYIGVHTRAGGGSWYELVAQYDDLEGRGWWGCYQYREEPHSRLGPPAC